MWVKRSSLGLGDDGNGYQQLQLIIFMAQTNLVVIKQGINLINTWFRFTMMKYKWFLRDVSAWYHVVVFLTTQGTSSNRWSKNIY